mmetsp:Transcript_75727/g.222038  ORF Transcript_75727/g.222038 Transcript_75727/m.222038 type:complete len:411 (-) Transcript_75727:176-1408(-)
MVAKLQRARHRRRRPPGLRAHRGPRRAHVPGRAPRPLGPQQGRRAARAAAPRHRLPGNAASGRGVARGAECGRPGRAACLRCAARQGAHVRALGLAGAVSGHGHRWIDHNVPGVSTADALHHEPPAGNVCGLAGAVAVPKALTQEDRGEREQVDRPGVRGLGQHPDRGRLRPGGEAGAGLRGTAAAAGAGCVLSHGDCEQEWSSSHRVPHRFRGPPQQPPHPDWHGVANGRDEGSDAPRVVQRRGHAWRRLLHREGQGHGRRPRRAPDHRPRARVRRLQGRGHAAGLGRWQGGVQERLLQVRLAAGRARAHGLHPGRCRQEHRGAGGQQRLGQEHGGEPRPPLLRPTGRSRDVGWQEPQGLANILAARADRPRAAGANIIRLLRPGEHPVRQHGSYQRRGGSCSPPCWSP